MGQPAHGTAYFGANHEDPAGGPGPAGPVGTKWTDIWGVGWEKEQDGVMGFPRRHPLADLPDVLRSYAWPDPDDERIARRIYEQAQGFDRAEKFLQGSHRETLWEKTYILCGMENAMCAFYSEPNAIREVLRRVMDFQLGIARHYVAVGIEIAGMGDDLGTQQGLILSPEIIRDFLYPEYRRLFDFYKKHGVLVCFHSCGHVTPILEMFMELGVTSMNPLQATANNLAEMRRITAGRMCLHGGIRSDLIVDGPVAAIEKETRRLMWELGRDGGYFCAPDQGMPWPEEHIRAVRDTVAAFGAYPLCAPDG